MTSETVVTTTASPDAAARAGTPDIVFKASSRIEPTCCWLVYGAAHSCTFTGLIDVFDVPHAGPGAVVLVLVLVRAQGSISVVHAWG
jgi:hypothetical protein